MLSNINPPENTKESTKPVGVQGPFLACGYIRSQNASKISQRNTCIFPPISTKVTLRGSPQPFPNVLPKLLGATELNLLLTQLPLPLIQLGALHPLPHRLPLPPPNPVFFPSLFHLIFIFPSAILCTILITPNALLPSARNSATAATDHRMNLSQHRIRHHPTRHHIRPHSTIIILLHLSLTQLRLGHLDAVAEIAEGLVVAGVDIELL
ncbi:hypothetical protein EV356DRAFT_115831 [Viridothelium virens]|uniref:Uncharacterized protein n=1 Tax=Viridothelium virens TaxID=1048519 RepID=A0A6A6HDW3_VIRVR|nr:hypothetical protein EV356DRAFT_115831 [Viridothelium virens]